MAVIISSNSMMLYSVQASISMWVMVLSRNAAGFNFGPFFFLFMLNEIVN